jgi:hypothetical protein
MADTLYLRVGGTYRDDADANIKIVDVNLQFEQPGYYYIADNGHHYGMNGRCFETADHLLEVVNLDAVVVPDVFIGGTYETERHDTVRIRRVCDDVEGYPFKSDVGDFYNAKGERYRPTPGSHLVKVIPAK